MLYQKAAGKAVQIELHCRPSSSASSHETRTPRGAPRHPPRPRATPPPHRHRQPGASWGPWRDPGYGWGETTCGLAMQVGTERSIFHASQFAEGLVKQLDGPSLWFVLWPERREQPWLLAGIPDFNTEELENLLRDLPVPDDTSQPAGMTMAEAAEVSDTL